MEALAAAAFTAGLLGGVHCAGMCGGIAGALSAASRGPAWRRVAAFNLGRVASYSAAGAAAGAIGGAVHATGVGPVQVALFVFAQGFVILVGLYVGGWSGTIVRFEQAGAWLWRRLEPMRRRLFPIDSDPKALGAGAVWGWIPCGLVYGMLPLAAASAGPARGALVLAAFGAGTLPALVLAGAAARSLLALRRRTWVRRLAGAVIVALGVAGIARIPAVGSLMAAGWACLG